MRELLARHPHGLRLFGMVFLTLYLELALIRFTSAEVLYLGYFSNFVLIAVFLGIGLGFLLGNLKRDLLGIAGPLLLALVGFVFWSRMDVSQLREMSGQLFFATSAGGTRLPIWAALTFLFVSITGIFAALAQATARCFSHYSPLAAYSIDIAGSLGGIALFTLHAWVGGTPRDWLLLAFALLVVFSRGVAQIVTLVSGVAAVLLCTFQVPQHYVQWSPYQRIDVIEVQTGPSSSAFLLTANNVSHQTLQPAGTKEPIYDLPYTRLQELRGKPFESVLVIGAGGGTDVSYAIRYGVPHIDAVEIDPEILHAGKMFHPNAPYADPRVRTFVNDGRAFMETADRKYDLIIFALTDSLATLSGVGNVRLESFLFTEESMQQARRLLTDDGVLVLYNYYRQPWLVDRLATMLTRVFGHAPIVETPADNSKQLLAALAVGPKLSGPPPAQASTIRSATDDWPFLYVVEPTLPPMYLVAMLFFMLCAFIAVVATRKVSAAEGVGTLPFLLMGAAFLLMETKSVVQFSLLFGATWIVNSMVFAAILSLVLAANFVVAKVPMKQPMVLFALLIISLAIQHQVPLATLLQIDSIVVRYVAGSLLLLSPIFFANLVFGYMFKDTVQPQTAFGWNVIGTTVGGALEYLSLLLGYRNLTVMAALLYVAAALVTLWLRRQGRASAAAG